MRELADLIEMGAPAAARRKVEPEFSFVAR